MVTPYATERGAGVKVAVEHLSGELVRQGHTVKVFTLKDEAWSREKHGWTGASVEQFPVLGPSSVGYSPTLLRALLDFEADLVHLHGIWLLQSNSVKSWSRLADRPFVLSPHGMLAPAAMSFSSAKKKLARKLYMDSVLFSASAVFAASKQEAADIFQFGLHQPIPVVPHGIHVPQDEIARGKEKIVLSLGRIHPVKGLELLLDAWEAIEAKHPDWQLRIVGPDEDGYGGVLKQKIADQDIKRVNVLAPVYDAEKYGEFARASVFVLPSQSENFGITVVESLAMKTPVIASRGTPWSDLETFRCGLWVETKKADFSQALDSMLNMSEEERARMGVQGKEWVTNSFSWRAIGGMVMSAYRDVLSS